jgi:inositol phosphorylceramide mannosyltransferase catalytic subunit
MLWSDESSREFIAEYYSWFLDTFDAYTYPIQRADAIRYFVLYHYGGVYLDLDVGCLRPLDPLLVYPVVLAKTIPVGVSNDLMFAEKGHSFMAQTIHNLVTFDHSWILNYPTVMFSTGPMFLSAQYGIYTASHPPAPGDVRILPKALYGKNAKPSEAPHAFFSHYYGSSWHADDAAFIWFLGTWGKILMIIGLIVLLFGLIRLTIPSHNRRRIGGYEVVMPRWIRRNGRWHLDLGWFTLPASGSPTLSNSPSGSPMSSTDLPLLPVQLDVRDGSPAPSDLTSLGEILHPSSSLVVTTRRFKSWILSRFGWDHSNVYQSLHPRNPRQTRDVLYFLPAIFRSGRDVEAAFPSHIHSNPRSSTPDMGLVGGDDLLDPPPYQASMRTGRKPGNSPSTSSSDDSPSEDGSSSISWAS